ncbi:MAG: PQQ-binding-like beta-propeller repeat protein [Planctomycetaceae bacterium]
MPANRLLIVCTSVAILFVTSAVSDAAENWPQWRGPAANGVAPGAGYPIKWSAAENVLWKYKLPGLGASTPVIWGNDIFLTCENQGKNSVLCLDRSGKERWSVSLGQEVPAKNRKASGSNPSAVTDGENVFVYFKSGELACLSADGKIVWQKNLQQMYGADTLWWDLGTSPVLTKKDVVVACMQSSGSYLAAFDKASGEPDWKQDRNLDAPGESEQSYTTPLVIDAAGGQTIVVLGADHVTGHNAATGKQLWIVGGLNPDRRQNWRSISSPVFSDGLVVAPYARGESLTAIRLGGEGNVTKSHVAWSTGGPAADVPTPVASDGKLYVCTDHGTVAMIDIASGNVLDEQEVQGRRVTVSASPVLAGGHLYVTDEGGTTSVYRAGDKLELVAENALDDFAVATPVFADGRAYIRTDGFLWCIGEK